MTSKCTVTIIKIIVNDVAAKIVIAATIAHLNDHQ